MYIDKNLPHFFQSQSMDNHHMSCPVVSIIIPAYNAEKYIHNCIKSLLSQTYDNFEIIIVDDGSKDSTPILLDEISRTDSRIKPFHKSNGGATSARKRGVEEASGEWILFVDADDVMPSDAIENLMNRETGNYDIIAGTIFYKSRNKIIKSETGAESISVGEYIHLLLNRKSYYGPCAKLIRKSLFDELKWNEDPRLFQNEDLLMLVQLASHSTHPVAICNDDIHYVCEDKEGSMSTRLMSYEGWTLLFIDLKSIIMALSKDYSYLYSDYVNYSMWSIYDCLLTQAINVPQDAYILSIIEDSGNAIISDKNKNVLRYLVNPIQRYMFCNYRKVRMGLKGLLKVK